MKITLSTLLLLLANYCLALVNGEPDTTTVDLKIEISVMRNPTCPNKSDGSAEVTVRGGQAPYMFNWNTFPNQHTQTAVGLTTGEYFVEVSDALGNKAFTSFILGEETVDERNLWCKSEYLEVVPENPSVGFTAAYLYEIEGRILTWTELLSLQPGMYISTVIGNDDCTIEKFIIVYQNTTSEH